MILPSIALVLSAIMSWANVGEGKFIHAPKPGAEVRVESLSVAYWARRFDGARRVQGSAQASASGE